MQYTYFYCYSQFLIFIRNLICAFFDVLTSNAKNYKHRTSNLEVYAIFGKIASLLACRKQVLMVTSLSTSFVMGFEHFRCPYANKLNISNFNAPHKHI